MSNKLLNGINSPSDLKALSEADMPALAAEIREFLVSNVERSGGHLASNLGAVEMTLAIHRVFDSPRDRIIFDVGHQSYVHKLLTGRREAFSRLREPGGLSGFTSSRESEHDPFGAGHSSTSVSAALGFAEADALSGEQRHTVCVIGDGACTGGMVHEALNNCKPDLPMVIVINENGMSISSTKGAFTSYLSRVRVSGGYRRWKSGTNAILSKIPLVGKPLRALAAAIKRGVKRLVYRENYFESLGLYYIGPIDGNDYSKTVKALRVARSLGGTVVVHLKTKKGKGYEPAESSPTSYHNVSCGDRGDTTFHGVAAEELVAIAAENGRVAAVTAAMGAGTGLEKFGDTYPERYFDVGIAEAHAITFSAGLAAAGYSPYAAIYSTFLQRAYDNILHDVALQDLPVRLLIDRAGLAVSDGATHHGIFDVSFLSHIPNMTVLAPAGYESLRGFLRQSVELDGPLAIRYSNCAEPTEALSHLHIVGDGVLCDFDGTVPEYVFITYGGLLTRVTEAKRLLASRGIDVGIIVLEQLKPLSAPADRIAELTASCRRILFAEEGIKCGGIAVLLASALAERGADVSGDRYIIAAIDDSFASPDTPTELYGYVGLSPERLAERMEEGK